MYCYAILAIILIMLNVIFADVWNLYHTSEVILRLCEFEMIFIYNWVVLPPVWNVMGTFALVWGLRDLTVGVGLWMLRMFIIYFAMAFYLI